MENRCGLVVDACLTQAGGHAERLAALAMIEKRADRPRAITLGADKGYDTSDFVNELRSMNVRPHVARRLRGSAIDRRTTRHPGNGASQRIRKRIEEVFGWMKTIGGMRRPIRRGSDRVGWAIAQLAHVVCEDKDRRKPQSAESLIGTERKVFGTFSCFGRRPDRFVHQNRRGQILNAGSSTPFLFLPRWMSPTARRTPCARPHVRAGLPL